MFDIVPSPGALSRTILPGQVHSPPQRSTKGTHNRYHLSLGNHTGTPLLIPHPPQVLLRMCPPHIPGKSLAPAKSPIFGSSQSGSHACQDYHIMESHTQSLS